MTPCFGCIHRSRLWGMDYCKIASWFGSNNEKMCSEYRRKESSGLTSRVGHAERDNKK